VRSIITSHRKGRSRWLARFTISTWMFRTSNALRLILWSAS